MPPDVQGPHLRPDGPGIGEAGPYPHGVADPAAPQRGRTPAARLPEALGAEKRREAGVEMLAGGGGEAAHLPDEEPAEAGREGAHAGAAVAEHQLLHVAAEGRAVPALVRSLHRASRFLRVGAGRVEEAG